MILIPRSVLKRFRLLCRRGGLHKCRTAADPFVTVAGGPDGYTLRAASPDVCIEYRDPAPSEAASLRLPLTALQVCEGADDSTVALECRCDNRAVLSWIECGVPRQHEVDLSGADCLPFPEPPTSFVINDAELWTAFREAVATTDAQSTRYALGCLQLRGSLGRIDATDGRQLLTQSGYRFGFEDDVLIPASAILGCRELNSGQPIAVGRSGGWVSFRIERTSVLVRIQTEGRFPKVDDLLPAVNQAPSQLELSIEDAAFLLDILPGLPSSDPQYAPLTFDLNGKVLLRCRDAEHARPTEVELTSSRLRGEAIVLHTDRRFVERALRLGFRTVYAFGKAAPVHCADGRRRYLWALLDAASAVAKSVHAVRMESQTAVPPGKRRKRVRAAMAAGASP